jgi:hypothetical protein
MKTTTRVVGNIVVSLAILRPMAFRPAAAATSTSITTKTTATSASGKAKVTYTKQAPNWAKVRASGGRPGTAQSLSTDWSWWSPGPGWTVKFTRSETNKMAFAFGACITVVGPFWPAPWAVALYTGCAAVGIFAGWAAVNGKCLSAFVPVPAWPISFSQRSC